MREKPEIIVTGITFGESPHWHGDRMWFSDFFSHRVHSLGTAGDLAVEVQLDDRPCGLGWLPDGDLLVVAMRSRQVRRVDSAGQIHLHADLSSIAPGPCNDMIVDARGNAFVGNFGYDPEDWPAGEVPPSLCDLFLVRPDGQVETAAKDLGFPNGSVITRDGSTLIVGESMSASYTAFALGEDGSLSDRRKWAEIDGGKAPDGCCLDAEGAIWMADAFGGGGCYRIVEGGEIIDFVQASQTVYACGLGGPDGRALYMMTAPPLMRGMPDAATTGRVEVISVNVPGSDWA